MTAQFQWQYFILPYCVPLKRSGYIPVHIAMLYKEYPDGRCLFRTNETDGEYPFLFGEDVGALVERAVIVCRFKNQEAHESEAD